MDEAATEPGTKSVASAAAPEAATVIEPEPGSHRWVALLLGAAAILAAIIGARATALASDATDQWQSALRTEIKRSAGALKDIEYLYQVEVPPVVVILGGRLQEAELRGAAANATGEAARILGMEADIQAGLVAAVEPNYELATNRAYALPGGGVDIGLRLADIRGQAPDLVALDPDVIQQAGDRMGTKASSMTVALLPLGLAALLGALAQPFARRGRLLLALGASALGVGVAIAAVVEVLG
jgi:hypothetical protein